MTDDEVRAAAEPFDPETEPAGEPVLPPGVTKGVNGALEEERDKLREQVRLLQHELDRADDLPAYEAGEATGSGHLVERLARVTAAMNRLPKRGFNKEQSYAFVAHADVLDAVRPALAAEGVAFGSTIIECDAKPEGRETRSGMQWCMWRVKVEMTFQCYWYPVEGQHGSPGAEVMKCSWLGFAQDYSDKGASKALTSAIKTFLIQQFLISTGDDPDESSVSTDSVRQATPRQAGAGAQTGTNGDLRAARNAALDFNQKLPKGTLSKIAKKIAGQGVVMNINDVAQLQKIAKAAARYVENPEGGEAWLTGDAPTDDEKRQAVSGEPDVPLQQRDLSQPLTPDGAGLPEEPVTLPGPDDAYWDPPLDEDDHRQLELGVNPRPPAEPEDGTAF